MIEILVDKMIADWMSIDKMAGAKLAFHHVIVDEMYLDKMTESKLSVDKMIADWMSIDKMAGAKMAFHRVMVDDDWRQAVCRQNDCIHLSIDEILIFKTTKYKLIKGDMFVDKLVETR
jgi:hypothetical protein